MRTFKYVAKALLLAGMLTGLSACVFFPGPGGHGGGGHGGGPGGGPGHFQGH